MKQPFGYIYQTTDLTTNKKYIGLHKGEVFDNNYFGSGVIIKRIKKKYGKDSLKVELIKWCYSEDELRESEQQILKELNCKYSDEYYNLTDQKFESNLIPSDIQRKTGGDNLRKLWQDEEFRNKRIDEFRNRKVSEHTKKLLSDKWKEEDYRNNIIFKKIGKRASEETKRKMSDSAAGRVFTNQHKENISNSLKGKKKTEEHVSKINKNPDKIKKTAQKHTGMKRSEEAKRKMSEAKKGKTPHNKGKGYFYNPETKEKILCKIGDEPNGFIRGNLPKS